MVNKKLGKICMIGMPGSGKSTIGRALSDHLKFNFYDTDEQIELESQSRIKDIFINESFKNHSFIVRPDRKIFGVSDDDNSLETICEDLMRKLFFINQR